ncbi:universal stress protein [Conexibacter sp. CPCC 206217]|uniref:universal stress protein n=1 Tax=Conexibacter sp. CPCC 206217 TaxID=3064574 RepID=UPI0027256484|nr:universal stress protein [Conexibacter sp. CPCC 206217]MDO8212156.1 universal stress protein [Conexibacter sp. CPCC 206217]
MTSTDADATTTAAGPLDPGPVLFAYDGCELAGCAIEQAGKQLASGRDALVLCVWQPADVGFVPVGEQHFDAANAAEVHQAAHETAAQGAALAEKAGFRAQILTEEAAPTWKGIVKVAQERNASLIVLGAHRHGPLAGHFVGSVASAVLAHSETSVLIVHQRA